MTFNEAPHPVRIRLPDRARHGCGDRHSKPSLAPLAEGRSIEGLRSTASSENPPGVAIFNPCFLREGRGYGIKVISDFYDNDKHGVVRMSGLVCLFDGETGHPRTVLEAEYLTDLRTGAGTGLAARYLARKNSKVLTIIGAGRVAATSSKLWPSSSRSRQCFCRRAVLNAPTNSSSACQRPVAVSRRTSGSSRTVKPQSANRILSSRRPPRKSPSSTARGCGPAPLSPRSGLTIRQCVRSTARP